MKKVNVYSIVFIVASFGLWFLITLGYAAFHMNCKELPSYLLLPIFCVIYYGIALGLVNLFIYRKDVKKEVSQIIKDGLK